MQANISIPSSALYSPDSVAKHYNAAKKEKMKVFGTSAFDVTAEAFLKTSYPAYGYSKSVAMVGSIGAGKIEMLGGPEQTLG